MGDNGKMYKFKKGKHEKSFVAGVVVHESGYVAASIGSLDRNVILWNVSKRELIRKLSIDQCFTDAIHRSNLSIQKLYNTSEHPVSICFGIDVDSQPIISIGFVKSVLVLKLEEPESEKKERAAPTHKKTNSAGSMNNITLLGKVI